MIALVVLLLGNLTCFNMHASPQTKNNDALCIANRLATGYGLRSTDASHLPKKRKHHNYDYYYDEYSDTDDQPKRAIVIGASVGMGKALSKLLAAKGYIVGMTARRVDLLEQIQQEIPTQTYIRYMDASDPDDAINRLAAMIEEMEALILW